MAPKGKKDHYQSINAFVGRAEELRLLEQLLRSARGGIGSVVTFTGEHGIGKTRLARELAGSARADRVTVLWGQGREEEGVPPYWPWAEVIGELVSTVDLSGLLSELGPDATDLARIAPSIRRYLSKNSTTAEAPAGGSRLELFALVRRLLADVSDEQPVLIILDDLQYCDPASLLLLGSVAADVERRSIMIVGTYTGPVIQTSALAGVLGGLTKLPWYHSMTLEALNSVEVGQLLETVLDAKEAESLAELTLTRTDGNPLFITEALRLLEVSSGVSAVDAKELWERQLPARAGVVIGSRLAHLSEPCRDLVDLAAVLGGEPSVALLALVAEMSESAVLVALEPAVSEGLLWGPGRTN